MSQIKSRDTTCECTFRKYLWSQGIRGYRKHAKMPGKPDLFFPAKKLAVFIDGCFWHKCSKCFVKPASNSQFWRKKIGNNVEHDRKVDTILRKNGIIVLRIWEHEIRRNVQSCSRELIKRLNQL